MFLKGENVTGQTSGAVATILAEDNANTILYVEHNRFLQVGEVVVGSVSGARNHFQVSRKSNTEYTTTSRICKHRQDS